MNTIGRSTAARRGALWAVAWLVLLAAGWAQASPLRVLWLGRDDSASRARVHTLMPEFGRDAIWFDLVTDPASVTPGWIARFDVIVLDAPWSDYPHLANLNAQRVVALEFGSNEKAWVEREFLEGVRKKLLGAVGEARRAAWQAFLAQREPEKREVNVHVANYERRPAPVTFVHPLSVKGSVERTQVAPDLRLELFAAEPDIAKPIALAWDERGRCWVAETRDYPHDVQAAGEGRDSIKICEDTDGDGRADKFTVFADRLNIPTSLVIARGGVIVAQPPRFLFLKDTDGDDRADTRDVLMEGWGIGDTHAQANNLHWGFDNWLYGCVGYSGYSGVVGGTKREFRMGTFRFKADGSALEFLHQFSNNSWGHSQNAAGDQFGGTANGAPIFYGGIPATIFPAGLRGITAKKINVEDRAHPITPNYRQVDVFGGYTAAAGSAFIDSDRLPARLQGKAMVCEPTLKLIALMDVQPRGSGYLAKDAFNLVASTDEWMSPVFAEVGPDGSVWFADWQNFIIQHNPTPSVARGGYEAKTGVGGAHINPLRDNARGRIYRVVWENAPARSVHTLHRATAEQKVQALSHGNAFWRLTAQRLLVEGQAQEVVPSLRALVRTKPGTHGAIHALWALHGLQQLDEDTHRSALLAASPVLRRNAVRALAPDTTGQRLFFSAGVVSDPDGLTRLASLVKLAEFPAGKDIQAMVKNVAKNPAQRADEWLKEAVRILARRHQVDLFREGTNLLTNSSLEMLDATGMPEGWKRRDYGNREANASARWEVVSGTAPARSGERAVRCQSAGDADTSLYMDVALKPNTLYRLSGWVRGEELRGRLSFNDHLNRVETERVTRDGAWTEVETVFDSGSSTRGSINILFVARGTGWFDDVKLVELTMAADEEAKLVAGDLKKGEEIFHRHQAACVLCHQLRGQGSTVGPALDGIALRKDPTYLRQSLLEPSQVLAQGYEGVKISPMPPMGDIFSPQEIEDILAYLQTLR